MTTTSLHTPKDYALCYHDMGFSVFVLRNPKRGTEQQLKERKKPAVLWDVYQIMRPSKIQIERWFSKNPDYNVAIVTGSVSKIIAFDVDGPNAVKRVEDAENEMSTNLLVALQNTMINRTGSGGTHIVFKVEEDISDISQEKLWSDGQAHSQILMQGDGHYIAAAPSIHPNNKKYEWNGKTPHLVTRQELNEFIRLVRAADDDDDKQSRPDVVASLAHNIQERPLTTEEMQRLFTWVKPLYVQGDRDFIIYHLSGTMRKDAGYPLEQTKTFFKLLCNASGYSDEDIDKSLKTVERTYKVPLEEVNGKAGLYEVLVASHEAAKDYEDRVEAFSRICQIINGEPESPEGDDPTPPVGVGSSSGSGDDNNNKKGPEPLHSGVGLLKNKTVEDDTTRIISFLAPEVKKRVTLKTMFDTREILYFDKTKNYYRFGGEAIIDAEIENITVEIHAPFSVRSYVKGEVRKSIADSTLVRREEFDADPYTINLENCLLDIISLNKMEHSPDHLTLSKFPIVYDSAAECPRIEKFLGEVIQDPNKLRETLKFWAYVLLKDNRFEKAKMCLGGGGNGKSIFIKLFEASVGEDNCSHLSLHDMEEDRFARARLFGKALNTYADNKSQKLKETGNLKTVISGDTIEGQHKFKPRFSFRTRAKIIISTNNPPETDDKTYAFYRRWDMTSFDNTFVPSDDPNTPNRADPEIINKLTTPGELSGWLNIGLRYLPVLLREGFPQEPMDQVKKEYERKADHVSRYMQNYCVIDPSRKDFYTPSDRLYDHYLRVCENDSIKPLDKNVFGSRLVEHSVLHKRKRVRKGEGGMQYVYEPIRLKHELQQEQSGLLTANYTAESTHHEEKRDEQAAISSDILECPHCALPGISRPIFRTNNTSDYQLHFIFRHPEIDFEEVTEE